jgi:hypothetical protein
MVRISKLKVIIGFEDRADDAYPHQFFEVRAQSVCNLPKQPIRLHLMHNRQCACRRRIINVISK